LYGYEARNMRMPETIARLRETAGKLNSKTGKILGVLLVSMLMATASASIFATFYGDTTATVRAADVQLVAGSDNVGGTTYPTASVSVSSTSDYASIAISVFASATNSPQPATYFTDLLQITNSGTADHSVASVLISGITDADAILGKIVVYYCSSQTDDPANNNVDYFEITDTTGGNVLLTAGSQTLAASATHYIEVVAYAADTATAGQAVTFDIAIQWA